MTVAACLQKHVDDRQDALDTWRVPIWQERNLTLAPHPDGPATNIQRAGYLQKRAGASWFRWNVRFFELKDGHLRWWRPDFKEQLLQPALPRVAASEPRPRPRRSLDDHRGFDLSRLRSVARTKAKFPYSTRVICAFDKAYTSYQLELRAEREAEILEWYSVLSRFAIEAMEVEVDTEEGLDLADSADADFDSGSEQDIEYRADSW